jgi:hypothetical protein
MPAIYKVIFHQCINNIRQSEELKTIELA